MRLRNTTDIPDKLIAIAVAFAIEQGVEIDEIIVKNKKEGAIAGQWGWYFPAKRKIVIILPRDMSGGFRTVRPHTFARMFLETRAEFLVMVMAHELRHAYQHQVLKWDLGSKVLSHKIEADAERYEQSTLQRWRLQFFVRSA